MSEKIRIQTKPLSEMVMIKNGIDYKKNPKGNEEIPIYGTGGIMGYTSIALNEGPAVLSGRKGSINRPFYVEGNFWNVDTIFCLKPLGDNDAKWLYYSLLNTDMTKLNEATGVPSVTSKSLYRLKINYFDPNKQKEIAHILTTCDSVIEKIQTAIAKYKAIKQGLLHDLFTRGLDSNGKLRPRYSEAPELYKESELGMIPKEWEVKRLGDVINAIDPQPDHRTPESVENGVPYLGINDIDNFGKIDLRKCRKVSTGILEEHKKRYQIRNGDIIFGKIGTIGEPKRLFNFNNLTLSANVILIQPQGIADYIYWYLLSESVNKQINNSIHTTSQPAFGMDKIRSLIIPMCEDIEQNEIAERLNAINDKIQTEETLLQKYQSIKRGLMGDLLGGKKEVV